MHQRLKGLLAVWFILQIVLPFTAPLQTCDLRDLLGTREHRGTPASPASPESSTTPTANENEAEANSFVSPLAVCTLRASTELAVVCPIAVSGPFVFAFALSPSPQVQQTVLRL